jgi:hypothetical protein
MLNMLTNITKAAVAIAVSPVAIVADVLTLPASSMDPHRGAFDRTAAVFKAAGECATEAIKPMKEDSHGR